MEEAYTEIAARLRGLREALDMSIEDMAARLEVAPETVAHYESGEGEIPAGYLVAVAKHLGVDLTVLVSGSEAHLHRVCLVRHGKGMSVERRKDYDYKSLAYRFVGRKMEPFLVTVPAKERDALTFNEHPGQEFIYMLSGTLEITIGDQVYVLEPGDSLYFTSRTPHALRGIGGPAEFLDVAI